MSKQIDLEKVAEKAWDIASDQDFDQFEACTALKDAALAIKQAQETIAALEREVNEQCRLNGMGAEREASLLSKVAALEKDAARYRWLRDENTDVALVIDKRTNYTPSSDDGLTGGYWDYEYRCGSELDEAIDTAMEASNAKAD